MVLVGADSPPPPPPSLGRRVQDGGGISLSSSSSSSSSVVVDSVGLRRPRNREVLSRYKSASTASSSSPGSVPVSVSASSSRRFLSPHKTPPSDDKGDGDGGVRGVAVSKRAQSTERRRLPSPIRDTKPSSSSASLASASVVAARRARPTVRAELFWPSSQSMSTSMIVESIPHLNKNSNNKNNANVGVSKSRAASTERRRPAASSLVTPSPSPSPLPVRPKPPPPSNGALTGSTRTELFRPHSTDRRRPTTAANGTTNNSRPSPTPTPSLSPSPSVRSDLFWPSSQTAATPESAPSSKPRPHSSTERQRRPPSPSPSSSPSSKLKPPSNALFSPQTSADQTLKPSANIITSSQSVHHPHHHQQPPPPTPTHHRKGTPERKGTPSRRLSLNQAENAKPSSENIQSRPGHAKSFTLSAAPISMSRSVDLTSEREKHQPPSHNSSSSSSSSRVSASRVVIPRPLLSSSRSLSQSINEAPTSSHSSRRAPPDIKTQRRTPTPTRECRDSAAQRIGTTTNATISCRERRTVSIDGTESISSEINGASLDMASDTESTSSASTVNTPSTSGRVGGVSSKAPRGTAVPARFWQDAVNRSATRRLSESGNRPRGSATETELSSTATSGKVGARQKLAVSSSDARLPSSSLSPSPFSSPQKATKMLPASPSRGFPSPTRSRPLPAPPPSSLPSTSANLPSPALSSASSVMMNFGVDARKGKRGVNQLEEAHFHRILHNRLLHWRFVNARAQASMNAQIVAAQKQLYGVWVKTAELRASVTAKKIKLQQARQAQIVNLILSGQVSLLDRWTNLRLEHLSALGGVVEALEAATLRVPVTAGVRADTRAVKEALSSAVDVMNALKSATTFLLPKAEKVNISVSELAQVTDQERILLEECGDSMAVISAFEIEERSLSIHLIEGEQEKARVLGHLMESAIGPSVLF